MSDKDPRLTQVEIELNFKRENEMRLEVEDHINLYQAGEISLNDLIDQLRETARSTPYAILAPEVK